MRNMKYTVYNNKGKKSGEVSLPAEVFEQDWSEDLVWQVTVSMLSNKRQGTASTKDRSEVSGKNQKPWRQKGTGRARHGSRLSNIWRGGGVSFGPTPEKKYDKKINRKMRVKSLVVALSKKMKDGQVVLLDSLGLDDIKTKDCDVALRSLEGIKGFETLCTKSNPNNVLAVLPEYDEVAYKSLRNLPFVNVAPAGDLNTLDVAKARYIVLINPEKVAEGILSRYNAVIKNMKEA